MPVPDPVSMSSKEFSPLAERTIQELEARTLAVFERVRASAVWRAATDPRSSDALVRAIIREVFFSVYSYQRHTTEAGFLMIGRLPKEEFRLISTLTHHKAEEAEHNGWAHRDYLLLGGTESERAATMTPACFAVAAVWWRMGLVEDPFGYLGAEYLFEYLTAIAAQSMLLTFRDRGFGREGFAFIIDHATEDVKHTNLLRHLVGYTVTKYPASREAMLRCFDHFAQVYPVPVWEEAHARATR